jgi:hypothetical protein
MTSYGVDGPGIESRLEWTFLNSSIQAPLVLLSLLYSGYLSGLFPVAKAARAWRWSSTPSSAKVKERVELYLYSPSGLSWPVLGWNLLLLLALSLTMWQKHRTDCRSVYTRLQNIASQTTTIVVSAVARTSKLLAIGLSQAVQLSLLFCLNCRNLKNNKCICSIKGPTRCTIYVFFIPLYFLAGHVSGAIAPILRSSNCSLQP